MPTRQAAEPTQNNDMILGELRGQVRELVHSMNNMNSKFDALTREVIALGPLAADINEIKNRVTELEKIGNKQTGAYGILSAILHSPVVMWVVMAAGFLWATATGKLKL